MAFLCFVSTSVVVACTAPFLSIILNMLMADTAAPPPPDFDAWSSLQLKVHDEQSLLTVKSIGLQSCPCKNSLFRLGLRLAVANITFSNYSQAAYAGMLKTVSIITINLLFKRNNVAK